ncbi:hypothetical protein F5887DRAFT_1062464 [Amanita rubescens]|nr:hypothetical protein F5887DRAFT_1062464 [Amanita rubescens]
MSRQDKATSERHTRTLRELLKKPENKACADCKRNDPRWASWNIGVFLCIRCSGIHRGMGTHISKVKSVDLDVWTPEQMGSIQKWGNRRANLYWEAHLKSGHMPPEHKMESFIRSKYESRRWAMDGSPPADPSALEQGSSTASNPESAPSSREVASPPRPSHATTGSISSAKPAPPVTTTRLPQAHQLLSSNFVSAAPAGQSNSTPIPVQEAKPAMPANNDLFSLDFHAPAAPAQMNDVLSSAQSKKNVKQDILSLFSTRSAAAASTATPIYSTFSSQSAVASPWATNAAVNHQVQPTSMIGSTGVGAWGTSSGWTGGPANTSSQSNLWGTPGTASLQPQPSSLFNTNEVWGASQNQPSQDLFGNQPRMASVAPTVKKDDLFDDIWGGFK